MNVDTSPLFEPLTVKNKTLRNRVVMPPMVTVRGIATPEGIAWSRGLRDDFGDPILGPPEAEQGHVSEKRCKAGKAE